MLPQTYDSIAYTVAITPSPPHNCSSTLLLVPIHSSDNAASYLRHYYLLLGELLAHTRPATNVYSCSHNHF